MKVYYDYKDKRDYEDKHEYEKCECRRENKYGKRDYECDKYEKYDERDYYDRKCCDEHKYEKCEPKSPCPYPIIFECTQGTGASIVGANSYGDATHFEPRSLGCISIDTTCLKNPTVLFNFNTIIRQVNVDDVNVPTRLTFALFKQHKKGEEIQCGSWDYIVDFDDTHEQLTNSYTFNYCECNSCPGCYTYYVKIISAINVNPRNILDLYNPTLTVFAKSGC